jgi:hypothetical protein
MVQMLGLAQLQRVDLETLVLVARVAQQRPETAEMGPNLEPLGQVVAVVDTSPQLVKTAVIMAAVEAVLQEQEQLQHLALALAASSSSPIGLQHNQKNRSL